MALQTKSFSVSKNTFTLKLTITENSTSVSGNNSSVSYKLELISTTKDFYNYGVGASVYVDGRLVASRNRGDSSSRVNLPTGSSVTLLSGTTTVNHNNDGSKSISLSYSIDMAEVSYTPGPMSGSGSMTLTVIPRGATISSAPNFTDEDNPVVKYNNPAGTTMELCIKSGDESKFLVEYRTVTGSSYTFNLTQSERETLQKYATKNTATVVFVLRSNLSGNQFFSSVSRTLTIKNPAPTLSPTIVDDNQSTVALTGDSSVMVRYASNARVTTGAKAVKFSTLKSTKVTCGGKSLSGDGVINGVEFGSFTVSATDSRGNTTTQTVKKTLVEYITPTCYIGEGIPNALGEYDFTTSGSAWNGDFGVDVNTLTAEYRYRLRGGDWGEWLPMTVQTNGNSYTATVQVTGLDYTATYEFQGRVTDKLNTVESNVKVVASIPTFDWGPNDFNFNVRVLITKYNEDGTKEVYGLERCGATIALASNVGTITSGRELSLTNVVTSFGGASVSNGGVVVPNDGYYLVSGAVHVSSGGVNAWVGCYVGTSSMTGSASLAYEALPGGAGTVVATPSVVKLSAGDRVYLRAEAPESGVTINADSRTRLTVAQIY